MIRLAEGSDCAAVTGCVREAYAHYVERIGWEPAPMLADYAELICRGAVYVLESLPEHTLQGVIVLRIQNGKMWIENVAIRPEYQHRGLGRRLLSFAEQAARGAGFGEVHLYTHELMTENIALYTRFGYVEVERRREDGFHRVFMRKEL